MGQTESESISGFSVPSADLSGSTFPSESRSAQDEVEAPDVGPRPLREAPRLEEVLVTAPRPQKQNMRNPLQGAINNYYRALVRRRTYNALITQHARAVAQQKSWNNFANAANTVASASALGGVAGLGGRVMLIGFADGVATQAAFDYFAGNEIVAGNLLISGGISSVSGPVFGRAGALTGSAAGDLIWTVNSKSFDFGVWSTSQ